MGFYQQKVELLRPAVVPTGYGSATKLTYDVDAGATLQTVDFGVEMQPRMAFSGTGDGERIEIQTGWTLHTPPGYDLPVDPTERIRYLDENLTPVGEPRRWPSADYPSGVDHIELDLEFKDG